MRHLTVLLTAAGRRVELINCIKQSAYELNCSISILTTDLNPGLSAACALADKSFSTSKGDSEKYLSELIQICKENQVDLVIPTTDTDLIILSKSRRIFDEIGVEVLISDESFVSTARNKKLTSDSLGEAGVETPKSWTIDEFLEEFDFLNFEVIAKPNSGSASSGIFFPKSILEIKDLLLKDYLIQELCRGDEYTTNVYVSKNGEVISSVSHQRISTRGGEVDKAITVHSEVLNEISIKIAKHFDGIRGPFCFQTFLNNGVPKVIEINARLGGGYPLAHAAGATFTTWMLEEMKIISKFDSDRIRTSQANILMLRYDSSVFLEK